MVWYFCVKFAKNLINWSVCVFVHTRNRELQLLLASKDSISILLHGLPRSLLVNTIVGIQIGIDLLHSFYFILNIVFMFVIFLNVINKWILESSPFSLYQLKEACI